MIPYYIEIRYGSLHPYPFNPVAIIGYTLHRATDVKLAVYDMLGREVKILVAKNQEAGTYSVSFDESLISSGVLDENISNANTNRHSDPGSYLLSVRIRDIFVQFTDKISHQRRIAPLLDHFSFGAMFCKFEHAEV